MDDNYYMQQALELAENQLGCTHPNPSVGCIIVKNHHIIAKAATAKGGRPHAETIALNKAGPEAKNATVYVTLEPCCHFGVTPPCVDALIKAEVKKVVIANIDPNPKVAGKGITRLLEDGIEVVTGVGKKYAQQINEGFFKLCRKGHPLVTLKLATSLDGKIALHNKQSKWITGEKARQYSHILRAKNDAIMVGIGTILADDPELTCRLKGYEDRSPIRIVLDSKLSIPLKAKLLKTSEIPTWIITLSSSLYSEKAKILLEQNIKLLAIDSEKIELLPSLNLLAKAGITRLLVEGGSKIATSFIQENLLDYLIWIQAAKIIGDDGIAAIENLNQTSLAEIKTLNLQEYFKLGNDLAHIYKF